MPPTLTSDCNRDAKAAFAAASGSGFSMMLPGLESETFLPSDVVLTPDEIAADIVRYFKPSGRILDPCRGAGAFWKAMPGADWCEISEGRDFFEWQKPVDWIVSNPPYSILDEWMEHSYAVATNIVYLLPLPKLFNSARRLQTICELGGMREVLVVTVGRKLGFPWGYACGAVHFETGYKGACKITPMGSTPNK